MRFSERRALRRTAATCRKGKVKCPGCRRKLRLDRLEPLSMPPCPKCDRPVFVPYRVAGYWLCEPLGGGGEGAVYKSVHERSRRICAVKVLHREHRDNPEAIEALTREREAMASIGEHPCIVRQLDGGCDDGEHYCALEYLEGERLDNRIARLGHISEQDMARLALDIVSAERHIVESGYLYKDLKPENIILDLRDRPILLDFGFAETVEAAANPPNDGLVKGSPHYLPPERLWHTGEGVVSEIYSLGMVMYHGLTGQTFFKSDKEVERLAARHATSLRLSIQPGSMQDCSDDMMDLVDKMIRKDPSERIRSFDRVERALRRCLPGGH